MKRIKFGIQYIIALMSLVLLSSCYNHGSEVETRELYSINSNFIVKADSLTLLMQQPEVILSNLPTDTIVLYKHEPIVVADIRLLGDANQDSVWVQVARDQDTFGWVLESELLKNVVPDDPISEFIDTFSSVHLIIFIIIIGVISMGYIAKYINKRNAPIVHFRDINSFYPSLLAMTVACGATFYAALQMFNPALWQYFYFNPTLNPFSVPPLLSIFLCSVWLMLILSLAAVDDTRKQLPLLDALLYLTGLLAVCAFNYLFFSIMTLYYIGFPMLFLYLCFSIWIFFRKGYAAYRCGNCGKEIRRKGICPYCHAENK